MATLPQIFLTLSLAGGAFLWIGYGLPGLFEFTWGFTDFCQSLFVRCLEYLDIIKFVFLWLGASVVFSGVFYASFKSALNLARSYRIISKLPLKRRGSVFLIDNSSRVAFTHGFLRPSIYISKGLLKSLDRDELKAVFLHELHHKKRYDPLRFLFLSFLKDLFFYIPLVRHSVMNARIRKEHEADDAAASHAATRLNLAKALVKVASLNIETASIPASITGGSPVINRIKRLIEGKEVRFSPPSLKVVAASIVITLFLGLSLAYPIGAQGPASKECSVKHCSLHMDKIANCKEHCKTTGHKH
ncbi:MAG: M56 family metallopeptidase [Deltaproteobacteria bacterium]|nr:M56 family metallopeptidase [Deltaproteobacteria bacterium]